MNWRYKNYYNFKQEVDYSVLNKAMNSQVVYNHTARSVNWDETVQQIDRWVSQMSVMYDTYDGGYKDAMNGEASRGTSDDYKMGYADGLGDRLESIEESME